MSKKIFIGTDSGATTTKLCAVWENGEAVSTKLLQRPTDSENGRAAVIGGWIAGIGEFLAQNNLQWSQRRHRFVDRGRQRISRAE